MTEQDYIKAIDAAWKRIIAYPDAQMCKHYAALILAEELEKVGAKLNVPLIGAIVNADDEEALQHKSLLT